MTLMGSIMHGYQYSIDIHKKSYVHGMQIVPWRGALKFISNEEQKCQIYHTLHTLLDEEEDNTYEILFNKFMTVIDNNESTQCLAKYFKQEYSQHKH